MNFSASQSRSSDITYSNKRSETYSGKFSYNLPFGRNNYIKPLSWIKGWPLVGASFSDLQIFYTPSAFRTGLNLNEKLSWNQTRSGIRSPDNYNFSLDRSLNLDYKITNNLSTKYSWSGQSKLNDYRGYAWMALRDLDPGTVTQTTEALNTSFSPGFFKWLRPSFTYAANYRWSNDLGIFR